MTVLRSVAAAMVLFALGASPVFAKVAFQDPGLYSFYRPNPHLMNGVPTPAVATNVATDTSFMQYTRHIDRVRNEHTRLPLQLRIARPVNSTLTILGQTCIRNDREASPSERMPTGPQLSPTA
jgi:hypothetical protein